MRIDFIISVLGIFGSVREVIELGNALTRRGHDVTVWSEAATPCQWLKQDFRTRSYHEEHHAVTDVLVLMDIPQGRRHEFFQDSECTLFKAMCMMGFDELHLADVLADRVPPTSYMVNLLPILREHVVCADGTWQLEFFKAHGVRTGVALGGINPAMFYPEPHIKRRIPVLTTGDPRPRKGSATLEVAFEGLDVENYWGTRNQDLLRYKLSSAQVFADNELRAGWCNPVAEAMACGAACITSDIGAVRDFAIHEETALVVPPNDADAFREAALRLLADAELRAYLSENGVQHMQQFTYAVVARQFEEFIDTYGA